MKGFKKLWGEGNAAEQGQGHLSRSRTNTKVTLFRKTAVFRCISVS